MRRKFFIVLTLVFSLLCAVQTRGQERPGGTAATINVPGTLNVRNFGATGNALIVFNVSITNGSVNFSGTNLTLQQGDVGKNVEFLGASATGTPATLATTIATVVNATNGTLANAATATATASGTFYYGHDDTPAFIAAINAMSNGNVGTTLVPPGRYFIDGPFVLQTNGYGSTYAQIMLPIVPSNTAPMTIGFSGTEPPTPSMWWIPNDGTTPLSTNGAILISARTVPSTAAICAIMGLPSNLPSNSIYGYSQIKANINNLVFRTYPGTATGGLILFGASLMDVDNIVCDTGCPVGTIQPDPNTWGIGVGIPTVANQALNRLGTVTVMGYHTGVSLSEHYYCENLHFQKCNNPIYLGGGDTFTSYIAHMETQGFLQGIVTGGGLLAPVIIGSWAIEYDIVSPWLTQYDIDDASGAIHGWVNYANKNKTSLQVNGAANVVKYNTWYGTFDNGMTFNGKLVTQGDLGVAGTGYFTNGITLGTNAAITNWPSGGSGGGASNGPPIQITSYSPGSNILINGTLYSNYANLVFWITPTNNCEVTASNMPNNIPFTIINLADAAHSGYGIFLNTNFSTTNPTPFRAPVFGQTIYAVPTNSTLSTLSEIILPVGTNLQIASQIPAQ